MEQAEEKVADESVEGGNVATPEAAPEVKKIKRLSWAELVQLFDWVKKQPPYSHESTKAACARASEELGFAVGESSLREAWVACQRDPVELVRPDVPGLWDLIEKLAKLEDRVSRLEDLA